jgi:hypothetical protein
MRGWPALRCKGGKLEFEDFYMAVLAIRCRWGEVFDRIVAVGCFQLQRLCLRFCLFDRGLFGWRFVII